MRWIAALTLLAGCAAPTDALEPTLAGARATVAEVSDTTGGAFSATFTWQCNGLNCKFAGSYDPAADPLLPSPDNVHWTATFGGPMGKFNFAAKFAAPAPGTCYDAFVAFTVQSVALGAGSNTKHFAVCG